MLVHGAQLSWKLQQFQWKGRNNLGKRSLFAQKFCRVHEAYGISSVCGSAVLELLA